MNNKYIIDIEYGSNFQKRLWESTLDIFLKALEDKMKTSHKKNLFNFRKITNE